MRANDKRLMTTDEHDTPNQFRLRELTYRYEIKRDLQGRPIPLGGLATCGQEAWTTVRRFLQDEAVEVFGVLCLTTKYRVICWHELSRGTLDSSLAHPRELFKAAIMANSAAVIVAHNHPSGDPTPSPDDIALTRRLAAAGELLGIPVIDHIVVGDDCFTSLRQRGSL